MPCVYNCIILVQVTALYRESDGTWTLDVTDKAADSSQRMGGFSGIVLADYLAAKAGAVNEPQADTCCSMGLNAIEASAALLQVVSMLSRQARHARHISVLRPDAAGLQSCRPGD